MFRRLEGIEAASDSIVIELDGESVSVPGAVSVAAALLYLDAIPIRNTRISGAARAPFCMMGVCFECLIEVDGIPDQRACQVQVAAGMRLRRQFSGAAQ